MRFSRPLLSCTLLGALVGTASGQTSRIGGANPWSYDSAARRPASSRVDGGSVLREDFGFYWETRVEPPAPVLGEGFHTQAINSPGAIHRLMTDNLGRTYFGYDVVVEVRPGGNYNITFKPLAMTREVADRALPFSEPPWMPMPAPRFPAPQTIRAGDIVALELLANSKTGQKIVDYVTVQEPTRRTPGFQSLDSTSDREFSFTTGAPRDVRPEDVEMQIRSLRLNVNGKAEPSGHIDETQGAVIWLYLPKRGRFLLSLAPRPDLGFRRLGEVRGTTLEFAIGSDLFTLRSASRIAPGQTALNLYVLHEPSWQPTYLHADLSVFSMGAASRPESLISKPSGR